MYPFSSDMMSVFERLPTLETNRLVLRQIQYDDVLDIFDYASDPQLQRCTSWKTHTSTADSHAYIRHVQISSSQRRPTPWGVVHKADGRLIGTFGFCHLEPKYQRGMVGYVLSPAYWGNGLATEALAEVIRFGFEELGLNRIEAICSNVNTASSRVLEKAGMKFEATLDEYFPINGEMRDGKSYRILRREWLNTTSSHTTI